VQGFPSHLPCLITLKGNFQYVALVGNELVWRRDRVAKTWDLARFELNIYKWRFNQQELYCTNSAIKKHKSTPRDLANKSLGFHRKRETEATHTVTKKCISGSQVIRTVLQVYQHSEHSYLNLQRSFTIEHASGKNIIFHSREWRLSLIWFPYTFTMIPGLGRDMRSL